MKIALATVYARKGREAKRFRTNPRERKVWDGGKGFGVAVERLGAPDSCQRCWTRADAFFEIISEKGEKVGIFRDAKPRCVIYLVAQAF